MFQHAMSSACSPCSGVHAERRVQDQGSRLPSRCRLTGQANHLGVTIGADIIKQKLPETMVVTTPSIRKDAQGCVLATHDRYPIDLTRYQLANCYMGRIAVDQFGRCVGGESD